MKSGYREDSAVAASRGVRIIRLPADHPSADLEILLAVGGMAAWIALLLLPLDLIAPLAGGCSFKALAGVPCVSCGMTRGVLALAEGNLLAALEMNPLFLGLVMLLLVYTPVAWLSWLGRLPRWRLRIRGKALRWSALVLLFLALGLNWAYLVSRGV